MQMQSSRESPLVSILYMLHFYASMTAGWAMFHNVVYPLAYFAKHIGPDPSAQLPIYFLNVLAFGCLVYTATWPIAKLIAALIDKLEGAPMRVNIK